MKSLSIFNIKSIVLVLIFATCWLMFAQTAQAKVEVYVEDTMVQFDTQPVILPTSNRTLVPFRKIFEALGAEVQYNEYSKIAVAQKGNLTIELPLNQNLAYRNSEQITLDASTQSIEGRTMVPLRFISESLGFYVEAFKMDGVQVIKIAGLQDPEPDQPVETSPDLSIDKLNNYVYEPINEPTNKADDNNNDQNQRYLQLISISAEGEGLVAELQVADGVNQALILTQPYRLVVDLQNTTNQVLDDVISVDNLFVSDIRVGQMDDTTTRVVFDLKKDISYNLQKTPNSLIVRIDSITAGLVNDADYYTDDTMPNTSNTSNTPNITRNFNDRLIILDAGHGGSEVGAIGVSGKYEKDLVLDITNQLEYALKNEGYEVLMTRNGDATVSLADRAIIANRTDAFAFVSIHANSSVSSSPQGLEVYRFYGSDSPLAQYVLDGILAETGQINRKVKEAGFYVIKYTEMPSILVEIGFISNYEEEDFLWNPDNQAAIVRGIVNGIKKYQGRY